MGTSLYDWLEKKIKPVIQCGKILEIGPGGFYPGMVLLEDNPDLDLVAIGYTEQEVASAEAIIKEKQLANRAVYQKGEINKIELPDHSVDAVVSFGALRNWNKPAKMLDEVNRVLKHNGVYYIGDARADKSLMGKLFNYHTDKKLSQLYKDTNKGYTLASLQDLLLTTKSDNAAIEVSGQDIWIVNKKQ